MGKTHLALKAAGREAQCYFVSLVPVQQPSEMAHAILEAFGIQTQNPKEQLGKLLATKEGVLLLDNFEHLLPAAALVAEILAVAPKLRLLVTSRERLGLVQEHLLELQGLPHPDDLLPLEMQDSAGLFTRAATRVDAGFELQKQDLSIFMRIHTLVSGSPLGILLAAGWVRVLSLHQIAQELEQNLELLQTNAADVALRHRSLQAVFNASWERLSTVEQKAIARLALLRDAFDLELARLVSAQDSARLVSAEDFGVLLGLVDKSLVTKRGQQFFLHEAVRQFAIQQLEPSGLEAVQLRLLARYQDLAKRVIWGMKGRFEQQFISQFSQELEHLRLCLDWAVHHRPEQAAWVVCYLTHYLMAGLLQETEQWLEQLSRQHLPKHQYWLIWAKGYAQNRRTNLLGSQKLAKRALASDEPLLLMFVHRLISSNYAEQVMYQECLLHDEKSLYYAQELAHPVQIDILTERGITEIWANLLDAAKVHFNQALDAAALFQSEYGRASALFGFSTLYGKLGDFERERQLLLEVQAWYVLSKDTKNRAFCAMYLGSNAARQGMNDIARQHLLEAQEVFVQFSTPHLLCYILADYAQIAFNERDFQKSALLIYSSIALLRQHNANYDWHFQPTLLEPHLDAPTRNALEQRAQLLSVEEALRFAKNNSHPLVLL